MSNYPNNRKESAFLQKLKQIRVNRAVYLCAIVVLISLSVVLAITAIANRAKKEPPIDTPTDTTVKVPSDTQQPPLDSEPTYNGIPELALPVSGTLSKKHSVDTQVFSHRGGGSRMCRSRGNGSTGMGGSHDGLVCCDLSCG